MDWPPPLVDWKSLTNTYLYESHLDTECSLDTSFASIDKMLPAPATTAPLGSLSTPTDNQLKPVLEPPKFQSKEEQSRTMAHYNEIFNTPSLTMTAEEQNAAIRSAFANKDILPKEKDLLMP